jgi:hypothetical protein
MSVGDLDMPVGGLGVLDGGMSVELGDGKMVTSVGTT